MKTTDPDKTFRLACGLYAGIVIGTLWLLWELAHLIGRSVQ